MNPLWVFLILLALAAAGSGVGVAMILRQSLRAGAEEKEIDRDD